MSYLQRHIVVVLGSALVKGGEVVRVVGLGASPAPRRGRRGAGRRRRRAVRERARPQRLRPVAGIVTLRLHLCTLVFVPCKQYKIGLTNVFFFLLTPD